MSLTPDELGLIEKLFKQLQAHDAKNIHLERYYEGKNRLKDLRISIPPQLTAVESVVGWAGTAVDVLEERLDLEGFIASDDLGVNEIFRANELDLESSLGHRDALIYGTGFVIVGRGQEGEADPLITIESPKKMTTLFDLRTRRLSAALLVNRENGGVPVSGTLYTPNENVYLEFAGRNWFEVDRDVHNLGRVLVSQLPNNPRTGDPFGRSEITAAVRSYTDAAMRTLLGAEVAREFYSAPQRYILGANEDVFLDSDGKPLNPWSVYQGRVLGIPYNEAEGVMPQVGQFNANDTRPYFDQVRAYAQLLAAETAIPANYLGFQTDNPASADAIRQMEARLVKRAERRQRQFGRTWAEVAKLALLVRDGEIPEEANEIRAVWRDPATPTRAAAADEAVKLIAAGVFLPNSEITYNRIGLTDADKQQLKAEKQTAEASGLVSALAQASVSAAENRQVSQLSSERSTSGSEPETVESFEGISTGDVVTLVDGRVGRVEHIMIGGVLGVPGSEYAITGSPEDPAIQLRLFENGRETENLINIRFSDIAPA
jgi:hypothetical protein